MCPQKVFQLKSREEPKDSLMWWLSSFIIMRNLPQTIASKQSMSGNTSPQEEPQPQQYCQSQGWRSERQSFHFNRVRALLTVISLAFLSLFLFIVYQRFGLIVLSATLSVIILITIGFLFYLRQVMSIEYNDSEVQIRWKQSVAIKWLSTNLL